MSLSPNYPPDQHGYRLGSQQFVQGFVPNNGFPSYPNVGNTNFQPNVSQPPQQYLHGQTGNSYFGMVPPLHHQHFPQQSQNHQNQNVGHNGMTPGMGYTYQQAGQHMTGNGLIIQQPMYPAHTPSPGLRNSPQIITYSPTGWTPIKNVPEFSNLTCPATYSPTGWTPVKAYNSSDVMNMTVPASSNHQETSTLQNASFNVFPLKPVQDPRCSIPSKQYQVDSPYLSCSRFIYDVAAGAPIPDDVIQNPEISTRWITELCKEVVYHRNEQKKLRKAAREGITYDIPIYGPPTSHADSTKIINQDLELTETQNIPTNGSLESEVEKKIIVESETSADRIVNCAQMPPVEIVKELAEAQSKLPGDQSPSLLSVAPADRVLYSGTTEQSDNQMPSKNLGQSEELNPENWISNNEDPVAKLRTKQRNEVVDPTSIPTNLHTLFDQWKTKEADKRSFSPVVGETKRYQPENTTSLSRSFQKSHSVRPPLPRYSTTPGNNSHSISKCHNEPSTSHNSSVENDENLPTYGYRSFSRSRPEGPITKQAPHLQSDLLDGFEYPNSRHTAPKQMMPVELPKPATRTPSKMLDNPLTTESEQLTEKVTSALKQEKELTKAVASMKFDSKTPKKHTKKKGNTGIVDDTDIDAVIAQNKKLNEFHTQISSKVDKYCTMIGALRQVYPIFLKKRPMHELQDKINEYVASNLQFEDPTSSVRNRISEEIRRREEIYSKQDAFEMQKMGLFLRLIIEKGQNEIWQDLSFLFRNPTNLKAQRDIDNSYFVMIDHLSIWFKPDLAAIPVTVEDLAEVPIKLKDRYRYFFVQYINRHNELRKPPRKTPHELRGLHPKEIGLHDLYHNCRGKSVSWLAKEEKVFINDRIAYYDSEAEKSKHDEEIVRMYQFLSEISSSIIRFDLLYLQELDSKHKEMASDHRLLHGGLENDFDWEYLRIVFGLEDPVVYNNLFLSDSDSN